MPDELEKFLKQKNEEAAQKHRQQAEEWRAQKKFITDFRKTLDEIIHPAMINILETLRKGGGFSSTKGFPAKNSALI